MAVFRDITGVGFPGGSSSGAGGFTGCQEVSIEVSGDEMEHSGCDQDYIDYRGLTNLKGKGDASFAGGPRLLRDACEARWKGLLFPDLLSADFSETATEMADGSDCDTWITVIGVTARSVEVTFTTRSMDTVLGASGLLGSVGDISVSTKEGTHATGLPTGSSIFAAKSMELVSIKETGKHKDFGEGMAVFKQMGGKDPASAGRFTGGQLTDIHTGAVGVFSFGVKSAATPPTAALTFALANSVVMGKTAKLAHAAMVEESFTVSAYSTSGLTTPFTAG